jgi:hypothetical protein
MPPVGRPRTRTRIGTAAPTTELGVPDLGLGGIVGVQPSIFGSGRGPWRMYIDEWEYVPELRWPSNIWLYDQMRTDSQAAGLLTAVMWGICQLRYVIDPNGAKPSLVKEISQDLNLPILGKDDQPRGRMKGRFSHSKFVSQAMLAVLYGHTHFEQVGEMVDGKWRLRKLAPRMPHTIRQINIADDGGLVSIQQWAGPNMVRDMGLGPEIPVDRLIAFIFQQEGASQVGRSMLRDIYRDWLLKDRELRIEAINHERAGGVPYATAPMGATVDEIEDLDSLMRSFRIGDTAGAALPFGAELHIAKGSGSDVDRTIKRLDEAMARRFLLQLANLAQGGQHVGSYALSETFEDFFLVGQRHIAQWYCDTMTEHLIEDITDWNYGPEEELTPTITWERTSEDALGVEQLATLVQRGVIVMDEELENAVRYKYLLPKRTGPRPEVTPGGPKQPNEQQAQTNPQGTGTQDNPPAPTTGTATQAAGVGATGAPSHPAPADAPEPSWLGKLMERLTQAMPFVHATATAPVMPENHVHLPEVNVPAPVIEMAEGAVSVLPPDIHLGDVHVAPPPPANVNVTVPRPVRAVTTKGPNGEVYVDYIYEEDKDA